MPKITKLRSSRTWAPTLVLMCFAFALHDSVLLLLLLLLFFRATPMAYGSSQARDTIRAAAACLRYNYSNMGLKPRLRSTPQLVAMLDP